MQTQTRKKFNCKTIRTKLVKFRTKLSLSPSLKYLMLDTDFFLFLFFFLFSSTQPHSAFFNWKLSSGCKIKKGQERKCFLNSAKKTKFPSHTILESNFSLSIKLWKRKSLWIWNLIKWQRMTLTMIRIFSFFFERKKMMQIKSLFYFPLSHPKT